MHDFANWVNAGLNLKHTSVVFAYCTNQEYISLDTGLRITVTYSSNEIGTDVSSSTPSSSGMTVRSVSKLSVLGARHVFCLPMNYMETKVQLCISERFLNLYPMTWTLNLHF